MKTYLKFSAFILLCNYFNYTYGQQACSTDDNNRVNMLLKDNYVLNNAGPFTIRVVAHILSYTNGIGGITDTELDAALLRMSNDLAVHNICLSLKTINRINNSANFNTAARLNFTTTMQGFVQPDAINIFFYPNSWNFDGYTFSIPGNSFLVSGTNPANSLPVHASPSLSHELGHCLGLYHTFPRIPSGPPLGGSCMECNDGTNCATCSDFVCDTYPDVNMSYQNVPCSNLFPTSVTPIIYDICNPSQSIICNPDNIMSYSNLTCVNKFTMGQGQRMRDYIFNEPILQSCIVPEDVFVQNKTHSSSNNLYAGRVSVTAGQNVTSGTVGPVLFSNSVLGELKSNVYVKLEPGFSAVPNISGSFLASIDPNFCSVLTKNNARMLEEIQVPKNPSEFFTEQNEFMITPNPSSGIFKIKWKREIGHLVTVAVYNYSGNLIKRLEIGSNLDEFELDLSPYNDGLYFIQISYDNYIVKRKLSLIK